MSVVNTPGLSEQNTSNPFFSVIEDIGRIGASVGTVVRTIAPLWGDSPSPQPTAPQPTSTSSGSNIQAGNTSYMPIVIAGGVLVAAIFLLKK